MTRDEFRLRVLLWKIHPHDGKYGDDGEFQCQGTDFKRDPIERLEDHFLTDMQRRLRDALRKSSQAAK